MIVSPEQTGPEDPIEAALQRAAERLGPILSPSAVPVAELQSSNVTSIREALNISASIISGETDEHELMLNAGLLTDRHQEHYIATIIVDILMRLRSNPNDAIALGMLAALRERANKLGFFLMRYTVEQEMIRLTSPDYVVAQSYGRHPDPKNPNHKFKVAAADCQCWIPPTDIVSLDLSDYPNTENGDVIWDRHLTEKIKAKPWLFGEVKDITSGAAMHGLRLAGAARSCAFSHIKSEVNSQRGDRPVRYMTAAIANVTGIVLPDGTPVRFADVGGQAGLKNERSTDIHVHGRYPASLAYQLVDRTVPVEMEIDESGTTETFHILQDWFTYIHQLEQDV